MVIFYQDTTKILNLFKYKYNATSIKHATCIKARVKYTCITNV